MYQPNFCSFAYNCFISATSADIFLFNTFNTVNFVTSLLSLINISKDLSFLVVFLKITLWLLLILSNVMFVLLISAPIDCFYFLCVIF